MCPQNWDLGLSYESPTLLRLFLIYEQVSIIWLRIWNFFKLEVHLADNSANKRSICESFLYTRSIVSGDVSA